MTMVTTTESGTLTAVPPTERIPRSRSRAGSWRFRPGHLFVLGYVILLALFGVIPVAYSIYLAFTNADGGFSGLGNFTRTARDYRFVPAVEHVAIFLVIWLIALTVFVVLLALLVHRLSMRRT